MDVGFIPSGRLAGRRIIATLEGGGEGVLRRRAGEVRTVGQAACAPTKGCLTVQSPCPYLFVDIANHYVHRYLLPSALAVRRPTSATDCLLQASVSPGRAPATCIPTHACGQACTPAYMHDAGACRCMAVRGAWHPRHAHAHMHPRRKIA